MGMIDIETQYIEPAKIFGNLYFVGTRVNKYR